MYNFFLHFQTGNDSMHSITIKASNYRVSKHNLTPLPTLFTLSINSQPLKLTWKKYPSLDKKLIPYFVHDKKKNFQLSHASIMNTLYEWLRKRYFSQSKVQASTRRHDDAIVRFDSKRNPVGGGASYVELIIPSNKG